MKTLVLSRVKSIMVCQFHNRIHVSSFVRRPSEPLLLPCKSGGDSTQEFATSTQARKARGANGSLDVQSQRKARPLQNAHARKEQERRDGEKELYDKVPEIVIKYGVKMKVSENKKFVTKGSKLEALMECIEVLDAKAKQSGDELQRVMEELSIAVTKAKQWESKAQRVMEELSIAVTKAKQSESKAQRATEELSIAVTKAKQSKSKAQKVWRKHKWLRSQVRSLDSDGAGDTESDWCDDDQTLIGRSSSHESDLGGSIRPSHSGV